MLLFQAGVTNHPGSGVGSGTFGVGIAETCPLLSAVAGTGSCAASPLRLEEAKGQGHGFAEAKRGWFASPRDGEAEGGSCSEMPGAHLP